MTRPLRWLCYALLAVGLLAVGYSATLRVAADKASKRVMVLVDWRELNQLLEPSLSDVEEESAAEARSLITDRGSHRLPWELLQQIPDAYVAYGEETVGDLLAQGILAPAIATTTGPAFEVRDARYWPDVVRGALRHGYIAEVSQRGERLVQLPLAGESVNSLPLAWRSDVIEMLAARGVNYILRPGGTEFFRSDGLADTLSFARSQPLMLFQGSQVPGYPSDLAKVARQLRSQRQFFGWVEFDDQAGSVELARRMGRGVLRVHSITPDEMEKYTVTRAVDRYELALTERGVRVLFLRPFSKPGLNRVADDSKLGFREKLRAINLDYFSAVNQMVAASGYELGVPRRLSGPPRWLRPVRAAALALATVAATLLLLWLLLPQLTARWAIGLLSIGVIGAAASAFLDSAYTLALLAAGIVFPALGFWVALLLYQRNVHTEARSCYRRLGWGLAALIVATAISSAGGLLIHGGMWDARTLLRIEQYRGVTLALALPVLLVAAYCWQAESLQDAWDSAGRRLAGFWQRLLGLWLSPIRYGDIAVILLAVGALGIVLLRSGNEGPIGVLGAEGWLRSFLESALDVRPRSKELLGHPLLVLFLLSLPWRTRLTLLLALGGILGQVSVLNTFLHLHTPLLISLQRVGVGLAIGVLSGVILGGLVLLAARLTRAARSPRQIPA